MDLGTLQGRRKPQLDNPPPQKVRRALCQRTPPEALMDIPVLCDYDTLPQDCTNGTPSALGPKLTPDHHRRFTYPVLRKNSPTIAEKGDRKEYA